MSAFSTFGANIGQILAGVAGNQTLTTEIVNAAANAFNPNGAQEDTTLAKAEAFASVNPAQAITMIQEVIKMLPTQLEGVALGLGAIKADTPPLQMVQAIEIARTAIKRGN
jgi:hypothetical protein